MATLVEGKNPGEYLVHEESCDLCREKVTLESGKLEDGTVVGKKSNGKYVQLSPAASDGSQIAAGILRGNTDASSAEQPAIIHRQLIVAREENLTWPVGITAPQKTTALSQLASLHIKVQA